MQRFRKIFKNSNGCSAIGMIHVGGLPGTPKYGGSFKKIIKDALEDAAVYANCKVDAILVENMHDIPYVQSKYLLPETTALMTRICWEIRKIIPTQTPCGVQILAGANKEAIAVAQAADFQFIRAEGFVFSHIADEGFTDANAGTLLRYRKQIDAENILVFTDIKKKHSAHAITSDVSISETAKAAEFFLTDGVIITGNATGDPADASQLRELKQTAKGPVLVGSGVTAENLESYIAADAVIVGTHFKIDGSWENSVDSKKVQHFMNRLRELQ
ncbi:uncharacterized protein F13E9.13, mitochondrial [Athalia rosae]|uniref:uncharacterized protein F13E9.13, mitochondrial n=1 Tax=Athalia rosae TaxID=37344 RepID=UPI00203349DD|nr:uncharacterized protein F13E9.13, mitochondrial [Athalia rosae]XP_048509957.1 uncharacterized protein F13E9.13, mitochondrial [Athalia rosae]XP_048509958.1 uncharacterized protein F13E9.13, mitochondrial [Athalia rosae]